EGQALAARIRHAERPQLVPRGPDEQTTEAFIGRTTFSRDARAELHDGKMRLGSRGRRRHRLAEDDRHWVRNPERAFPEEASAFETEDAAPDAIAIDRHDRHVEAFDNL